MPLQDRGELANLPCNARNSGLAERDDVLREVERRVAVMIEVFAYRVGEGCGIDALDVEQKVVRVHGVQTVGCQAIRRKVGDVERHDAACLADDSSGEDVAIGKGEPVNTTLTAPITVTLPGR